MTRTDDVTVLVPLHRSAPFAEVVAGNIRRLADRMPIVVSDASGEDDTLERLAGEFAGTPGVSWLPARDGIRGWVDHCNDLAARVRTPYFMWLPHDDEIDGEYVARCRAAFDEDAGLGAVVGRVESVTGPGLVVSAQPLLSGIGPLDGYRFPANGHLARWNLGLLFRAVCRTELFRPIPHTTPDDEWADMVWGYGLSLATRIRQVDDAVYRKRFFAASTHAGWRTHFYPRGLPFLIREIGARLPADEHALAAEELAGVFADVLDEALTERNVRADALQEHLDTILASRSYRATASLRRVSAALR